MGPPCCGKTSLLNSILKPWVLEVERTPRGSIYTRLSEWDGVLIGGFDRTAKHGTAITKQYALDVLQTCGAATVFAEGTYLDEDFAKAAVAEGFQVYAYWIEISAKTTKIRSGGGAPKPYLDQLPTMEATRDAVNARWIDGEQPFELVEADLLTAWLADLAPHAL